MENKKIKNKNLIITWTKRLTASLAIGLWIITLYNIFKNGESFSDQAPLCIFSTMTIFGVLTAIYKGLEYWERSERT